MSKKLLIFSMVMLLGASIFGASAVSAHGWFQNASPEDIAQHQQNMFENQANLLGLDINTIKDAWASGKTLQEIAEENGITQDQLQAKMQAQHEEQMQTRMQALVDQGVITQDQANSRLEFMKSMGNKFGEGNFRGGPHPFGMGMHHEELEE